MFLNKEKTMQRRNTNQRQIVYHSLEALGHATVEALIEYIRVHEENISLATIYRNISILLEEQKIKRVKLQNETVLETVKADHFHFVCEACGNIYDVCTDKGLLLEQFSQQNMHEIKSCDVALYGLCQKCKTKEKKENEVCM